MRLNFGVFGILASQALRPGVSMDKAGGAVAIWSTAAGRFAAKSDRSVGGSGETLVDSGYLHPD